MNTSRRFWVRGCIVFSLSGFCAPDLLRAGPLRRLRQRRFRSEMSSMCGSLGSSLEEALAQVMAMFVMGMLIAIPILLLAMAFAIFRKELELTREQWQKLLQLRFELLDDVVKRLEAVDKPSLDSLREVLLELDPIYQKKIRDPLDEKQAERFDQLVLQFQGARGLTDPQVAKKLALSADQTKQVAEVVEITQEDLKASVKFFVVAALMARRVQQQREAAALLSDEQRKQFESMKGKPSQVMSLKTAIDIADKLLESFPDDDEKK